MCILLSGKQGDNKDRLLCSFCCQVNKDKKDVSCVHFVVK